MRATIAANEYRKQPMKQAATWMQRYEKFWTEKLDSLARYLYQQEELQTWKKPASPKGAPLSRRSKTGTRGPTRKR